MKNALSPQHGKSQIFSETNHKQSQKKARDEYLYSSEYFHDFFRTLSDQISGFDAKQSIT